MTQAENRNITNLSGRTVQVGLSNRRSFIGGSDARIIMGDDEAALLRLWREKRGEVEPEDLSGNLIVQLGPGHRGAQPALVRGQYRAGHHGRPAARPASGPPLDGGDPRRPGRSSGAVFEAKFMLPWSFSEEAAAEKYMPQLQHNMWVVAARTAVLSVITGGGKWVEIKTHADPLYQHLIVTAERKFWRCVESGEPPALFGVEPPKPRIEAVRIVDMSSSNAWAEFAAIFSRTRSAHLEHEQAKAELKSLVPEDAQQAIGHGVRAKRSKSGAISFDLLERGGQPCSGPVNRSARLAARSPRRKAELVNPEKSLVATIRSDGSRRGRTVIPLCPAVERARHRAQDLGPARDRHRADDRHRSGRRHRQSHDGAGARLGRMDCLGLAGLRRSARPRRRIGWARR